MRIACLITGFNSVFHTEESFKLSVYDIYNGTYNGKIGYTNLYASYIAKKLVEMGFHCGFFNIGKQEFSILIPIVNQHLHTENLKRINIKGHLFKINFNGSLDLYSRADYNEAMTIGMFLINKIREMMECDEYKQSIGGTLIPYKCKMTVENEAIENEFTLF